MTTFQIKCFMVLANALNFTKAANILFITQPALSRNIAALENELGVVLFERTSHKVTLTPAGRAFSTHCDELFNTLNIAIKDAKSAEEGKTGVIRFGIQSDSFESTTADLITAFYKEYPLIQIDIQLMSISALVNALSEHRLDVIVAADSFNSGYNNELLLSKKRECLVVPPDHPLASLDSISMNDFPEARIVMLSRQSSSYAYDTIMGNLMDVGYVPKEIITVDNMAGVMMLVACKKGVAILHEGLADQAEGRLRFIPIRNVEPFCRYLMWNAHSYDRNPCVSSLINFARNMYGRVK
ncbi:MAG: LysR family transcriptional regulator [Mogibacterium sp.]|nr:LysR family transcriptional regulator [Mogibacterium sp.]